MRVIQWGNPPRPDYWWLTVDHVCPHCDPPTIYRSERDDLRVKNLIDVMRGNCLFHDQATHTVITQCPNCGGIVKTTKPEDTHVATRTAPTP